MANKKLNEATPFASNGVLPHVDVSDIQAMALVGEWSNSKALLAFVGFARSEPERASQMAARMASELRESWLGASWAGVAALAVFLEQSDKNAKTAAVVSERLKESDDNGGYSEYVSWSECLAGSAKPLGGHPLASEIQSGLHVLLGNVSEPRRAGDEKNLAEIFDMALSAWAQSEASGRARSFRHNKEVEAEIKAMGVSMGFALEYRQLEKAASLPPSLPGADARRPSL